MATQVCSNSLSVKVGCTRNIKDVSPSSLAQGKRTAGRKGVLSKAFSRYTSEQLPEKHGTPRALISPIMRSRCQSSILCFLRCRECDSPLYYREKDWLPSHSQHGASTILYKPDRNCERQRKEPYQYLSWFFEGLPRTKQGKH